jgi:predicted nucleic acid-binding protein
MNNKAFVDSDIIIDLITVRGDFYKPAAMLFDLGFKRKVELYTTAVVLANVFYVLRKTLGKPKTKEHIKGLHVILEILPIDKQMVDNALNSTFTDFEDALQYFSVRETDVSVILTRNIRDYKVQDMTIQTPEGYVTQLLSDLQ